MHAIYNQQSVIRIPYPKNPIETISTTKNIHERIDENEIMMWRIYALDIRQIDDTMSPLNNMADYD